MRSAFAVCFVASLLTLPAAEANAQGSPNGAAAEALFDEGKRSLAAGDLGRACDRFAESQRIDPAVGTLLYLADCRERRGQLATAWATFREASSLAHAKKQDDREKKAKDRADALEKRLSWLTIEIAAEARVAGLVVKRDGQPMPLGLVGIAIPVDPGAIVVSAEAPGHATFAATVEATREPKKLQISVPKLEPSAGAAPSATVTVPPPPSAIPAASASPSGAATVPPPAEKAGSGRLPPTSALVAGGVGVVAVAVGAYFGQRAFSQYDQRTPYCDGKGQCDQPGLDHIAEARTAATISTILVGVGVAALGTGTYLWVSNDPQKPTASLTLGARGSF